jgi:hypothetical protein
MLHTDSPHRAAGEVPRGSAGNPPVHCLHVLPLQSALSHTFLMALDGVWYEAATQAADREPKDPRLAPAQVLTSHAR